jgi:hypothetical protein
MLRISNVIKYDQAEIFKNGAVLEIHFQASFSFGTQDAGPDTVLSSHMCPSNFHAYTF